MRTKWQGLGIMSQSRFIATLTLRQTPINDSYPVKTNLPRENVSKLYAVFSRCIYHCYRTVSVIHSIYSLSTIYVQRTRKCSALQRLYVLSLTSLTYLSSLKKKTRNTAINKAPVNALWAGSGGKERFHAHKQVWESPFRG